MAAPSYYATCSFTQRNGVFYVGGPAPSITLSQATPNAYYVLNYYGTQVTSGTFSGTTCTPTPPTGGWIPGWYRIYFTGTQTDANYGPSYGATSFPVIRNNPHFLPMPAVGVDAGGAYCDIAMRGVMGCGMAREAL